MRRLEIWDRRETWEFVEGRFVDFEDIRQEAYNALLLDEVFQNDG